MNNVDRDPKQGICRTCDGQGKFEDGQGQWWLCRDCAGYGSLAARAYGEKYPEKIKPTTLPVQPVYRVEWSDIAASPWGDILYSVEADKGFR